MGVRGGKTGVRGCRGGSMGGGGGRMGRGGEEKRRVVRGKGGRQPEKVGVKIGSEGTMGQGADGRGGG